MGNEITNVQAGTAIAEVPVNEDFMMGLAELKRRADMVTTIKGQIMRKDTHYGVIPGCGNKPTLLKNGAELLCMAFKLASDVKVEIADLGNGHREYTVTTTLSSICTGQLIATGIGSCSTMESKYRYRGNEAENTGKPVPKAYWYAKKNNDTASMKSILGGAGLVAKKDENGSWMIFKKGEKKLENTDIADCYNTVLKMASKRSLIDATLKATGGSCEFTQDLEDGNLAAAEYYSAPETPEYSVHDEMPTSANRQAKKEPTREQKTNAFVKMMKDLESDNPEAYAKYMVLHEYSTEYDVPEAKRKDVYNEVLSMVKLANSGEDETTAATENAQEA